MIKILMCSIFDERKKKFFVFLLIFFFVFFFFSFFFIEGLNIMRSIMMIMMTISKCVWM